MESVFFSPTMHYLIACVLCMLNDEVSYRICCKLIVCRYKQECSLVKGSKQGREARCLISYVEN